MKGTTHWLSCLLAFSFLGLACPSEAAEAAARGRDRRLSITVDRATGKVLISSRRPGVLQHAANVESRFERVHRRYRRAGSTYAVDATASAGVYRLKGYRGKVDSGNLVGHVNLRLPPGLSLIANPLSYTNNTLAFWMPIVPDGAQVYKFTPGGGFEVSTFDAIDSGWSNPNLDVSIGTGFYFHNPSTNVLALTFVGELLQGELVNPLPAGISTKGALVPQFGSINTAHNIPGESGDEIRVFTNDLQGGGAYEVSIYTADQGWLPDIQLGPGQGFWIQKQHPQDWVRYFVVN
jgi:hypothetical protein